MLLRGGHHHTESLLDVAKIGGMAACVSDTEGQREVCLHRGYVSWKSVIMIQGVIREKSRLLQDAGVSFGLFGCESPPLGLRSFVTEMTDN